MNIAEIASDPTKGEGLSPEEARVLLTQCAVAQGVLLPIAFAGNGKTPQMDRLLTCKEAAGRLQISTYTLYREAATFPFTRREEGKRRVRFSEQAIEKWIRNGRRWVL